MDIGSELYRKIMLGLSGNPIVKRLTVKYGGRLARRFIAAEDLLGAIRIVRELNDKGIRATMDFLGEGIKELSEAEAGREEYIRLLGAITDARADSNVSLKPTQMGLALDEEECYRNIRRIAAAAAECGNFVRIDMEDSTCTESTITLVKRLHAEGYANCGTVIQAYLHRSARDAEELIGRGIPLRLVKGAYKETPAISMQAKSAVKDSFKTLIRMNLDQGKYTAIASHDSEIIDWTTEYAREHGVSKDRFEFQMLYGLRVQEQIRLAREGYRVRCYVPYGTMWYPYYTRRLAEKPANLLLVARNMFR